MLVVTGAALTALVVKLLSVVRGRRGETPADSTGLASEAAADGSL